MTLSLDPRTCLPRHGPAAPAPSRTERLLARSAAGRVIARVIRKPEYGVLYGGIFFWVIACTLGLGRPLIDILAAHV